MAYYDDMSEGAALNYLAGLEDAGDLAALRQLALDISAGTVAGALSVSGAITGGSTGAFTGAVTAAGVTSSAAVQAAAASGFVVGASGPKILSGTGSPESVVSAPVGSTWTDTAATTGAVAWRKVSGTGSSGWVVEYGDTGRRAVASAVQTNYAVASSVNYLSRIGATVFYQGIIQKTTGNYAANDIPFILPAGFRPQSSFYQYAAGLNTGVQTNINIPSATGEVTLAANTAAAYLYLNLTFRTADAWPTSLPGSAA